MYFLEGVGDDFSGGKKDVFVKQKCPRNWPNQILPRPQRQISCN